MRRRLGRALLVWSIAWSVGVAIAVSLAARQEVEELLDDTLVASAELLAALLPADGTAINPAASNEGRSERFAWQVVAADGRLLLRSHDAPDQPLFASASPGFGDTPTWRVYGLSLGNDRRMLYVAQTREERLEAQYEGALTAVLAALAIGLLGQIWLRYRVQHELTPLRTLSERLAHYEPSDPAASLGEPERQEFEPMHHALHDLGRRLRERLDNERAFSAHAAHALRTPLAGIDAQLAVALQEAAPPLQPRLRRVREAAGRLQRVVAALIGLFRSGTTLQRGRHPLAPLLQRLPVDGLAVHVDPEAIVDADPDLLSAALANLLDNASRQGATEVRVEVPTPTCVRVIDDGPGVAATRRDELQQLLSAQRYEAGAGLGLMLADRVARAHGGALVILAVERGFGVELRLAACLPPSTDSATAR
jgi:signal transduction histidine kinase